jgi:polar amino acid transport system permease protein
MEASKAIGLTFYQALGYVLLPSAAADPADLGQLVHRDRQGFDLLSVIGVAELLLSTQQIIARTFMTLEFYLFAGFLFFVINYGIELLGRHIEKRVALP